MSEHSVYDASLEVAPGGACLAHVLDLPGCFARGADEAEALARLSARLPDYYAWLSRHDEYTPVVSGPFVVNAREWVAVPAGDACVSRAFFPPDAEPVTDEDLDWLLALLGWAYADLLARAPDLPDARALAGHVAQVQDELLAHLGDHPEGMAHSVPHSAALDAQSALEHTWQAAAARLRATSDDERIHVVEREGQPWTMRRVLRASILHARFHSEHTEF